MHKVIVPIRLVSLSSKKQEESLFNVLSKLYDDVLRINSQNWLQRHITDPNGLIILILPTTEEISVDKINNAIAATPFSHYLGIFFPKVTYEVNAKLRKPVNYLAK